jgi:hypothetical protein
VPQLGFSAARRRISARICAVSGGRPCRRPLYVQRRRTRSRCQRAASPIGPRTSASASAATPGRAPPAKPDRQTLSAAARPGAAAPAAYAQHQDLKLLRPLRTTKENQQLEQTANDPVTDGQTVKQQTSSTHLPTLPRSNSPELPLPPIRARPQKPRNEFVGPTRSAASATVSGPNWWSCRPLTAPGPAPGPGTCGVQELDPCPEKSGDRQAGR